MKNGISQVPASFARYISVHYWQENISANAFIFYVYSEDITLTNSFSINVQIHQCVAGKNNPIVDIGYNGIGNNYQNHYGVANSHLLLNYHHLMPHLMRYSHTDRVCFRTPRYPLQHLTHWDRVTHECVNKLTVIGSYDGLSPGQRQAIIWTNAGILLIRTLGTNFGEILSAIHTFSFKKMHLKMSSAKGRLFHLGLNELNMYVYTKGAYNNTRRLLRKVMYHANHDSYGMYLIFCNSSHTCTISSAVIANII